MTGLIEFGSKPSIYGTGLIALDIVVSSQSNNPIYNWAGGTCGNVLTILSYLGWNSFPISRINSEPASCKVKQDLMKWGVRLEYAELEPVATVPVITQEIISSKNGSPKHRFHWRNCPKCGSWLPNYKPITLKAINIIKENVQRSDVYYFDRVSPAAIELAKFFKSLVSIIFFEPSAKGDERLFKKAINLSDIVKY